jgi:hypothetical protein
MPYSVESAHALLKCYITSSQGDLLTTWLQIRQAVSSQIENIKAIAAKDRIQTPLHLNSRVQYQACFGYITNTALRLANTNYTSSAKPLKTCTGVFKRTTGLPCAHKINDIQYSGESLHPSDFHGHWNWDRYLDVREPTLEPLVLSATRHPLQVELSVLDVFLQASRLQRLGNDDVGYVTNLATPGLVCAVQLIYVDYKSSLLHMSH